MKIEIKIMEAGDRAQYKKGPQVHEMVYVPENLRMTRVIEEIIKVMDVQGMPYDELAEHIKSEFDAAERHAEEADEVAEEYGRYLHAIADNLGVPVDPLQNLAGLVLQTKNSDTQRGYEIHELKTRIVVLENDNQKLTEQLNTKQRVIENKNNEIYKLENKIRELEPPRPVEFRGLQE